MLPGVLTEQIINQGRQTARNNYQNLAGEIAAQKALMRAY